MAEILYIEDHFIFGQQVVEGLLSEHDVDWVKSVAQAKEQWNLSGESYQLILCDYDLPDGKGSEFVAWVRSQGSCVAVIAVSAHGAGNEALVEAGANVACPKLKMASSLLGVVGQLLASPVHQSS